MAQVPNSVQKLLNKSFTLCSSQEKNEVKRLGRPTPDLQTFTQTVKAGGRTFTRKFNKTFYEKNTWLCGCETKTALFCFPCLLFGGDDAWTKNGFTDLNHFTDRARKHASSSTHLKNTLQLALLGTTNIAASLDSAYRKSIVEHNEKVTKNRYVLNIIINCIRFCGIFELALRGHDETSNSSNPGIFRGLINFSAELDHELKTHIMSTSCFKGTSNTIQNELLQVMFEVCQQKIFSEIKQSHFLAVIADETSDVSNIYQMAVVFRYIVENKPVERFWKFLKPKQHNAESLAACILEELKTLEMNQTPLKLIAQTYDGASVMSGTSGGVQTIIKRTYTNASYIHCYAHQLNLVMMKAASINRQVKVFFSNIQGLCAFFSNSPQRTSILDEIVRKRLPRPVATRWTFHSRTVSTIHNHRNDLIKTMETILNSNEIQNSSTVDQAAGYLKILKSLSFMFWLRFFQKIMPMVEIMYSQFQKVNMDSGLVQQNLLDFEKNVQKIRDNIIDFPDVPEGEGPSHKKRKNVEEKTDWTRQAQEVCDVIITQMKDRFQFSTHLTGASLFLPSKFSEYENNFPLEIIKTVVDAYSFLDLEQLKSELSTIYAAEEFKRMSGAVALYDFMKQNELQNTFTQVVKLLEVIITIPMSSSEAERCFSTLKRIKTFLRNSMSEERLSALAMLSIEKDMIGNIPDFNQQVIDKFAILKERRMDFLFKS